jgi:hypothetical protein
MLGRGKHRNMRKGACFMELASLLAGERWTDHPACTHPLLATLARLVNDCTTDAARQRLAVLVPSAIGLTTDDLHADARIALRCAGVALPVVAADRQRAMAVAVLACDRVLAELDGRPTDRLEDYSRSVLAQAPHAARWAESFTRRIAISPDAFRRHAAPSTVTHAVTGIAEACIPDPDQTLYDLLWVAIDDCAVWVRRAAPLDQHPVSDRSRKAYSIRY